MVMHDSYHQQYLYTITEAPLAPEPSTPTSAKCPPGGTALHEYLNPQPQHRQSVHQVVRLCMSTFSENGKDRLSLQA